MTSTTAKTDAFKIALQYLHTLQEEARKAALPKATKPR